MAIVEFPVVTRAVIAQTFRPASITSVDAALKTLRANDHLSKGVTVATRAPHGGGRLNGRLTLYAALNRDAALLARVGEKSDAARVAAKAADLEQTASFRGIQDRIGRHRGSGSLLDAFTSALSGSVEFREDVVEVTRLSQAVRVRFGSIAASEHVVYARIRSMSETMSEVVTEQGEVFALPSRQLIDWALPVGAAVVVHTAAFGAGTGLWQLLPGLVSEGVSVDTEGTAGRSTARSNPFDEPPKPLTGAQVDELRALLDGGPTVGALAPVAIARVA